MTVEELQCTVSEFLTDLEVYFKDGVELTFLARCTTNPKGHMLVSNDDPEAIVSAIRELQSQDAVVTLGTGQTL